MTLQPSPTPHFAAALRACNALWDRRPQEGAVDSGATGHFLPMTYQCINHKTTVPGEEILVQCANDTTMASAATNRPNLQNLPVAAAECHKFKNMSTPLLSVKTFCENNLDVLFKQYTVTVTNADGKTVLKGTLYPATDLYMVPLNDTAQPQGGGYSRAKGYDN